MSMITVVGILVVLVALYLLSTWSALAFLAGLVAWIVSMFYITRRGGLRDRYREWSDKRFNAQRAKRLAR